MKTSIITIIKDEQLYLDQWIAYHINIGVDRLFILEDVGSTSHASITEKYEQVKLMSVLDIFYNDKDKEYVRQRRLNNQPTQKYIMQQAFSELRKGYDWCFPIDADEYITSEKPLKETLLLYNDYDAVLLRWQNYNANGHYNKPEGIYSLIDTYTEKCGFSEFDTKFNVTTKLAININKFNKYLFSIHHPDNKSNWCMSDFSKDMNRITYANIYIRHYITKSFEEYMHKLNIRGMQHNNHRKIDEFFEYNQNMKDKEKIDNIKELYYK